jgi:preprotein translocase subunit SecA
VLKYDDVMNRQRKVVYEERRRVLKGEDMHDRVRTMIQDVVSAYVVGATDGFPEDWDLEKLWTALGTLYPISLDRDQLVKDAGGVEGLTTDSLTKLVVADALSAYDEREEQLGPEVTRELERRVVLSCWTASGARTCTRWTTSARASACGPTPSATRWWSTSARATTCSTR